MPHAFHIVNKSHKSCNDLFTKANKNIRPKIKYNLKVEERQNIHSIFISEHDNFLISSKFIFHMPSNWHRLHTKQCRPMCVMSTEIQFLINWLQLYQPEDLFYRKNRENINRRLWLAFH